MRVGAQFMKQNDSANRDTLADRRPRFIRNRPVTDESRLVTAPILLVNTGMRKHWIAVSGATGRTLRRAATGRRDDRIQCYECPVSRDEPSPGRCGAPGALGEAGCKGYL
jgi:hypothetical protein